MDSFPAHIREEISNGKIVYTEQTVTEHCRQTAFYAKDSLLPIGLGHCAYLAGLLHDCGKFTQAFSDYLWAAQHGESVRRGSVNHTFAGVQYLFRTYYGRDISPSSVYQNLTCELLSYAVGAHHGLFDMIKNRTEYGFPHRLNTDTNDYDEAVTNFISHCAKQKELNELFECSVREISCFLYKIFALFPSVPSEKQPIHFSFYVGMLTRLLLSAVIEGDRRDTAEFTHGISYPDFPTDRSQLWTECLTFLERKLERFPQDTPIQKARADISAQCRKKADGPGGVYQLNVPTGGGKTLASLRYAFAHGARHGKQRIIFVVPLLSIIDQNSSVIRDFLPRQDIILEHHSNVVQTESEDQNVLDDRELLAENWSAPLIITTLVQFLNTLFSGKTSSIRRFQALCDSVIIFDEIQTVPTNMLSLFNLAVNFLSEFCGATVILCSATQPCLDDVPHPLIRKPENLVTADPELWRSFRRTIMMDAGDCTMDELPSFILEKMKEHRSLLVVCNKKDEAGMLYRALSGKISHIYHLSASMCMAHRRSVLHTLSQDLSPDSGITEGILCISTQVIEAGVDISFDCVIRLLAGMDSAVQAAGRCNRNGESNQPAPVYLLQCNDENLQKLTEIQTAKNASLSLLQEFKLHPEEYSNNLTSEAAISAYYRFLYSDFSKDFMDFPLPEKKDSILNMLSNNPKQTTGLTPQYTLWQSFQTAGQEFHVFDENTVDVLVPYGKEGRELVADLCSECALHDLGFVKKKLEELRPYTISLYQWQFDRLTQNHALYPTSGGNVLVLQPDYYDPQTGLSMESCTDQQSEVNSCNFLM